MHSKISALNAGTVSTMPQACSKPPQKPHNPAQIKERYMTWCLYFLSFSTTGRYALVKITESLIDVSYEETLYFGSKMTYQMLPEWPISQSVSHQLRIYFN